MAVTRAINTSTFRAPWWLWPNVLSLDAPIVTLVWQWWFAANFKIHLASYDYIILFATVWLLYALDRWLDAWKLDLTKPHSSRHAFYFYYRWQVAIVWLIIFMTTTIISLTSLSQKTLLAGFALLALCAIYFILVHVQKGWRIISKEARVGVAVSLGVTLCLWTQINAGRQLELALATLCFALLITLNCMLIAVWEETLDKAQQFSSIALTISQRWLESSILIFLGAMVALSFYQRFYIPIVLAGVALFVLHGVWDKLNTSLLRVLADVVLLTPLLLILITH
jgi:hypothetical protein